MTPKSGSLIKFFRLVGFLEATSFLVLLFIAMPLKYFAGLPEATRLVGMAHGLLFVAYVLIANYTASHYNWPIKRVFFAFVAATLPFGPFGFDKKLLAGLE